MKQKPIRILICDDHELFRTGISEVLRQEEFVIVGEASDGHRMFDKYFSTKPDIVLADIAMPDLSGYEAARKILAQDSGAKILLVSMYSEEYIGHSYALGIKGVLSKDIAKDELKLAIKVIAEGGVYFGAKYPEDKLKELADKFSSEKKYFEKSIEVITEKEEEILLNISKGLKSSEIADKLGISKKTVDTHRQNIMQKFQLKSLAALIKFSVDYVNQKKTH